MPYPETQCYWLDESGLWRVSLRVFTYGRYQDAVDNPDRYQVACPGKPPWPPGGGRVYLPGHDAAGPVVVYQEPAVKVARDDGGGHWDSRPGWDPDDPRWPTICDQCGQPFAGQRQTNTATLYRPAGGTFTTWREAAPGAMIDAWWQLGKGPDGIALQVKLPSGVEWAVDGVASNCGYFGAAAMARRPEGERSYRVGDYDPNPASGPEHHRCWVRHGDPKADPPTVGVDKAGHTCAAGAGSIQGGDYHGFLRAGRLTPG